MVVFFMDDAGYWKELLYIYGPKANVVGVLAALSAASPNRRWAFADSDTEGPIVEYMGPETFIQMAEQARLH